MGIEMDDYSSQNENYSVLDGLKTLTSLLATVAGITIILIGLKYSIDMFGFVFDILKNPHPLTKMIDQWSKILELNSLKITLQGQEFPIANILSLMVVGIGALILVRIALAMMKTGAKIVSWTSNEREAVKKILKYAFGPSGRPTGTNYSETNDESN